jgi:hypothetical protein
VRCPRPRITCDPTTQTGGDGFGCNGLFLLIGGGLLYQSSRDLHAANRDLRAAQANARSSHPLELSFPDGTQKEEREKVWGVSDYDSVCVACLAWLGSGLTFCVQSDAAVLAPCARGGPYGGAGRVGWGFAGVTVHLDFDALPHNALRSRSRVHRVSLASSLLPPVEARPDRQDLP